MSETHNAENLIKKIKTFESPNQLRDYERYFKEEKRNGDIFIGVRMGIIFKLAKENIDMSINEIEKLLQNPIHEIRVSALSIMAQRASKKRVTPEELKELYELYINNHKYINNWDLVDLASYKVVGKYLFDKPRDILYKLAKSDNMWERRTAIVSTAYFIKQGDLIDTIKISEILINDKEDLIHKATGWMLRYLGDQDMKLLKTFLDKHAKSMPRTTLRYTLEHFDKEQKDYYMKLKKA